MSVPAEKLIKATNAVQLNYQEQIVMYKKMLEISDTQLEQANALTKETEGVVEIQKKLITSLTAMNDRYEVLLKERDDFIKGLTL